MFCSVGKATVYFEFWTGDEWESFEIVGNPSYATPIYHKDMPDFEF